MARTVEEIQNQMLTAIANDEILSTVLTSLSKVAVFRLFTFIVASAISLLEKIFDDHKAEIDMQIKNQKSGRPNWYREMALLFQYGFSLVPDKDYFDNTGATQEQIDASKIVKYAAVSQPTGKLVIKIAGEVNNVLSPIPPPALVAFKAYTEEFKWAGVDVEIISFLPDKLYLTIRVEIDPLVLDANGMSILNGNYPVNDAISAYMKQLPFDGQLVLAYLTDKLQSVEGVIIPTILLAESSWIDADLGGYGPPQPITIKTIPVSGYFEIESFDNISYVV